MADLVPGLYRSASSTDPWVYKVENDGKVTVWSTDDTSKKVTIDPASPGRNAEAFKAIKEQIGSGHLRAAGRLSESAAPPSETGAFDEFKAAITPDKQDSVAKASKGAMAKTGGSEPVPESTEAIVSSRKKGYADMFRDKMAEMRGLQAKEGGPSFMSDAARAQEAIAALGDEGMRLRGELLRMHGIDMSGDAPKVEPPPRATTPSAPKTGEPGYRTAQPPPGNDVSPQPIRKKIMIDTDGDGIRESEVIAFPGGR